MIQNACRVEAKNELNKCMNKWREKVRDIYIYFVWFNCCWKDLYRFEWFSAKDSPFLLRAFQWKNYNYNFFLQPLFYSPRLFSSFFFAVCARAIVLEWMETRRCSVHISFTTFYKMTRFCATPLFKSVCCKRHHGKWKEFKSLYNSHGFSFQSNSMHFSPFVSFRFVSFGCCCCWGNAFENVAKTAYNCQPKKRPRQKM